jgi:hypothetical protein
MKLTLRKTFPMSNLKLSRHTVTLYHSSVTICSVTGSRSSVSKSAVFPALLPMSSSVKATELNSETSYNRDDSFRIFH